MEGKSRFWKKSAKSAAFSSDSKYNNIELTEKCLRNFKVVGIFECVL